MAFVLIAGAVDDLRARQTPDVSLLVFCPLTLWFGLKILKNAIVNDPGKIRLGKVRPE